MENTAIGKMKITKNIEFIYDALGEFEDGVLLSLQENLVKRKIRKKLELAKMLNIHDSDGIRNIRQVKRMLVSIKNRKHILSMSGMPNVKILKTRNNKLVLFDGHHSVLAYMAAGKKYLHEVPYILIENKDEKRILENNIANFFGGHLKFKRKTNWHKYTVNWQAPRRKQLCMRAQKNMGELFDVIRVRYNV